MVKRIETHLLFFIFLFSVSFGSAQTGEVQGFVTEKNTGIPLVGVHVSVGMGVGTTTDAEGKFRLELNTGQYSIEFRYVGYRTQKVTAIISLQSATQINVELETDESTLNTIVISGSRFEKKLSEETVTMDVIKPGLIANANNISIDQSIEKVPGVNVIDGQANIRGGSGYSYGAGSRVLLLLDDLPILTADAAYPLWTFVPIENIEQIEIIKGAASALYGSSALNGIINVRTAYPGSESKSTFSMFNGFYGSPKNRDYKWWGNETPLFTGADFSHAQKFNRFDLVTGAYVYYADSYLQSDYSRFGRLNINTRYRFSDKLSAGINLNTQLSRTVSFFYWHDIYSGLFVPADNTLTYNQGFRLSIDPFINYYDAAGNRHKFLARYFNADNITESDQGILSELFYGEYQFQHAINSWQMMLTSGVVANFSRVDAELYGDSSYAGSNEAIYLQLDKKIADVLNLSGGMRYEWNQLGNAVESRPVFRLGANYQIADYTFLRASWGQGYRFPTIAEKYIRTNVSAFKIYPNPDLESETGWSTEAGLKQGFAIGNWQAFADVSVFMQRYFNMMEFTFGYYPESGDIFPYGFKSLNIGNTQISGFEITMSGAGKLGTVPLNILGGYTYIDPIFQNFDSVTNEQSSADYNVLKYRFRHTAKVDAEVTL
ncbi:MAG: TonB-dependent receptor, partial [Chitinophagales bacterium]